MIISRLHSLGKLTRASKMVEETEVEVYTYSKTGLIESGSIKRHERRLLQHPSL